MPANQAVTIRFRPFDFDDLSWSRVHAVLSDIGASWVITDLPLVLGCSAVTADEYEVEQLDQYDRIMRIGRATLHEHGNHLVNGHRPPFTLNGIGPLIAPPAEPAD